MTTSSRQLRVPAGLGPLPHDHRPRIEAVLGPADPADATPPPFSPVLLCFTNRSGSNYFAALLASTGQFNEADELLNAEAVLDHVRAHGRTSLAAYWRDLGAGAARHGRFTVKAGLEQLVMLIEAGVLDGYADRLRCLHLVRSNILDQAISAAIAWQSGRWTSAHTARCPDEQLVYDRARIAATAQVIAQENRQFQAIFAANGIAARMVEYDAVLADPAAAVRGVGAWLGLPGLVIDPARIALRRQAGPVNQRWRSRYLAGL